VLNLSITYTKRAKPFEMNKRTVRHNPLHDLQAPGSLGRYMIIEDQSKADLIRLLLEVFGAGKTMMWKQLL
jgi:hypothetical protein